MFNQCCFKILNRYTALIYSPISKKVDLYNSSIDTSIFFSYLFFVCLPLREFHFNTKTSLYQSKTTFYPFPFSVFKFLYFSSYRNYKKRTYFSFCQLEKKSIDSWQCIVEA